MYRRIVASEKEHRETFATDQRLYEQEVKSQIDVLNLRIENLAQENSRQAREVELLKKALEEATRHSKMLQ